MSEDTNPTDILETCDCLKLDRRCEKHYWLLNPPETFTGLVRDFLRYKLPNEMPTLLNKAHIVKRLSSEKPKFGGRMVYEWVEYFDKYFTPVLGGCINGSHEINTLRVEIEIEFMRHNPIHLIIYDKKSTFKKPDEEPLVYIALLHEYDSMHLGSTSDLEEIKSLVRSRIIDFAKDRSLPEHLDEF